MRRSQFVFTTRVLIPTALALGAGGWIAAQVNAPPIGVARLTDSTVRTLYGLPANVVVDSHVSGRFDAASFSDQAGLVAKNGRIQLVRPNFTVIGEYAATEPRPLLNVDGPAASAVAWLPSTHSLLRWTGTAFDAKVVNGLDAGLRVTSVRLESADLAQFLLTDNDGAAFEANVSTANGDLTSLKTLPGVRGNAFWQNGFVLYQDTAGIHVVAPNGNTRTVMFDAGVVSFDHISTKWVLLTSTSDNHTWAMNVGERNLHLSEVPTVDTKPLGVTK